MIEPEGWQEIAAAARELGVDAGRQHLRWGGRDADLG